MENIKALEKDLQLIEKKLTTAVSKRKKLISAIHPSQENSAKNLIQYLALRNEDVRQLQDRLHQAGLSSLASSESHILKQIQSIRQRLGANYAESELSNFDYYAAEETLNKRTVDLFGTKVEPSVPHIMVTLDNTFEKNEKLLVSLLKAGMNIARINCAHGDEKNWESLIQTLEMASKKSGQACKIYMDIAGPKMRIDFPGKGRKDGKIKVVLGQEIELVEMGVKVKAAHTAITCFESGVIGSLKVGERVILDDGRFEGLVLKKKETLLVKITRISSKSGVLKKDKGLNLPDSNLNVPMLSEADQKAIAFMAGKADLVGCSFLRKPSDIQEIKKAFAAYPNSPKLILKIETPEAVSNLPLFLLEAMTEESFGVMIARGDLAVEIGFERLSEIQDEILWICEAANTPVIWATQVLETFSKSGIATRSEVTDAAHAAKAECVMLNKGDYIVETIQMLKNILLKSGAHRHKKRYSMRPLSIASNFLNATSGKEA